VREAGLRVVVVDDNVDFAYSLSEVLRGEGHLVEVAHQGEVGVETVAHCLPDVVLVDIGLPDLDGYGVLERLKTIPELEQTLFLAVSGYGREEDRRRSRQAGFLQHLVKPVDYEYLRSLLRTVEVTVTRRRDQSARTNRN
jgi:CheY-like chemotaxis protein